MKKQVLMILAAMMVFAGCQNGTKQAEQTASIDLKEVSEALYDSTVNAIEAAETQEAKDLIIEQYIDTLYALLDEHMGAIYSDTLFSGVSYMFTQEQKQNLFAKMPKEMLESETIEPMHKTFLLEVATSAGNPYTDFTALTPEGEELSLSELVGKTDYVLVDFWASWCGPCRRLIPVLKDVYASQPKGRLQILSCSCDRDEDAWRQALEEEQMPWPQMREDEQYVCNDKYGVVGIPTTILIDKEGMIIARNPDEAELEQILWGE